MISYHFRQKPQLESSKTCHAGRNSKNQQALHFSCPSSPYHFSWCFSRQILFGSPKKAPENFTQRPRSKITQQVLLEKNRLSTSPARLSFLAARPMRQSMAKAHRWLPGEVTDVTHRQTAKPLPLICLLKQNQLQLASWLS